MLNLNLYHLTFTGPVLLGQQPGKREQSASHFPADSLFAALIAALVTLGEDPKPLIEQFKPASQDSNLARPPFLLTSAFPYVGSVRFYPVPALTCLNVSENILRDHKRFKKLKRIKWASEALFKKIIANQNLDAWLSQDSDGLGRHLQGTTLWLTAEEAKKLPPNMEALDANQAVKADLSHLSVWQNHQVPRVTVDRLQNSTTIFGNGRLLFKADCGLWFGIQWYDEKWREPLTKALSVLADNGLGAARSAGYGQFSWQEQPETCAWPYPKQGHQFITLSRYHPHGPELPTTLTHKETAYNLISVGGWLHSHHHRDQRRRRLWFVSEGSILHASSTGPWGDIVDVRPDYTTSKNKPKAQAENAPIEKIKHPVWRYGVACPVAFGGTA